MLEVKKMSIPNPIGSKIEIHGMGGLKEIREIYANADAIAAEIERQAEEDAKYELLTSSTKPEDWDSDYDSKYFIRQEGAIYVNPSYVWGVLNPSDQATIDAWDTDWEDYYTRPSAELIEENHWATVDGKYVKNSVRFDEKPDIDAYAYDAQLPPTYVADTYYKEKEDLI